MANLSWQYYKGYYDGFNRWTDPKAKTDASVEKFFNGKNKLITDAELSVLPDAGSIHFELETIYPGLLTGSGYAHGAGYIGETKIGFHFDHTTGMPVIPGSSVKGTLRSVFPQFETDKKSPWLIKNINNESEKNKAKARYIGKDLLNWQEEDDSLFSLVHQLEQHIFEGLNVFASADRKNCVYYSLHERDIFYDAFPVKGGGKNGKKILGMDAITPHGDNPLKNPVPLPFVKILPGVTIKFNFSLGAPPFLGIGADERRVLFGKILVNAGVGAKTNVGYGQFKDKQFMTMKRQIELGMPTLESIPVPPKPIFTNKQNVKE